jgi:hypothetical protein
MADDVSPVMIELRLQSEQMQAQLKMVTSQLEALGVKAKEQKPKFEGMTEAVKGVAKAFIAFEGLEFLKKSAEVAVENAKGFNLMANQLMNSAGATREQSKALDEQLEKLSQVSGVLVTDIRPNFAKLVNVTHDTTEAMKLQKMAMDISAGTGKNLSVVTMALARAHEGNFAALNKLTPGIKNANDKMKYLEDTYGGLAETAGSSDPFARMQVSIEGLQKAFGDVLLPVLNQAVDFFQKLIENIKPFVPVIMGVAGAFVAYQVATAGVSAAMTIYDGVMALSTLATEGFTLALASTGIGAIAIAVGALTAALLGLNMAAGLAGAAPSKAAIAAGEAARKKAEDAFKKNSMVKSEFAYAGVNVTQSDAAAKAAGEQAYKKAVAGVSAAEEKAKAERIRKEQRDALNAAKVPASGATAPAVDKIAEALATYRKQLASEQGKYQTESQKLLKDHLKNVADIIAAKKGELTDAFKQATQVDSGALLADMGGSVTNLIGALKEKLAGAKKLAEDTGKLAGLGYSQEFVQQIVAQGPQMGDQLAQQLLAGTPEQAKQVQDLISQVGDFSKTGVDQTAQQFAQSQSFLVGALKDENTAYAESLNQLVRDHEVAMAKLQVSRDQATIKALQAGGVTASEKAQIASAQRDITKQNKIVAAGGTTVSVTANTNASPSQIASDVVNAIKFNSPVVVVH